MAAEKKVKKIPIRLLYPSTISIISKWTKKLMKQYKTTYERWGTDWILVSDYLHSESGFWFLLKKINRRDKSNTAKIRKLWHLILLQRYFIPHRAATGDFNLRLGLEDKLISICLFQICRFEGWVKTTAETGVKVYKSLRSSLRSRSVRNVQSLLF